MTRDEILSRYQNLRKISKDHHQAAVAHVSRQATLSHARSLGMMASGCVLAENDAEMNLLFDLALYTAKQGRSGTLDRYARAQRLAPQSDERLMLDAMRNSRFSIWRVERLHEVIGVVVFDVLRESEAWVVDLGLEASAWEGMCIAGRLYHLKTFWMMSGAFAPVDQMVLAEVAEIDAAWRGDDPDRVANDPRFATAIYRAAIAWGKLDGVAFRDPEENNAREAA